MIEFSTEPFADGELARFSFSGDGNDHAWKAAIETYVSTPRKPRQFFLIDNRDSRGTASFEGIQSILLSLMSAGVTSLRVAQVSGNKGFDIIASLTEEIGKHENFEVASILCSTIEAAEVWLAEPD